MDVYPDYAGFAAAYAAGRPQVLWTALVADLDTPVSAMLKLARDRPNSFLLESVEGGAIRGRYSFIGRDPDLIWRCRGNAAQIARPDSAGGDTFVSCPIAAAQGALASLRAVIAESRIALPDGLPPMSAGLFGYIGYDMARLMERLPDANPDLLGLPDGLFLRPTVICVFDGIKDTLSIVTPVRPVQGIIAAHAYAEARERLAAAVADFGRRGPRSRGAAQPAVQTAPEAVSNISPAGYRAIVERAKEYIVAGDIFQVVPSQRFRVPFKLPPFALYRALRRLNPSPFLFYLAFEGFAVVGSSPEIMVRVRHGQVTIRPIAGTRRRGATPDEDRALAAELLVDPKERAEHLMLLDLGRNDVGRVAAIGSVRVTDQMVIECYSHVMHIVSNVEGTLDPQRDVIDALIAGFPAGTVSGAPKVRAMEIIDELEPERRGIYGGCIGYIGASGELDTCIALRTGIVKDGMLYVQAGGGVVADSDPEAEYQETCNKARALLRAAEDAAGFADPEA
ncbi:MAG TPA: anthranilate synthase component I [Rhodospirillales bacterium]|nr:anthranilate synthase component I [Rhodospirillales bacterium]